MYIVKQKRKNNKSHSHEYNNYNKKKKDLEERKKKFALESFSLTPLMSSLFEQYIICFRFISIWLIHILMVLRVDISQCNF